MSGEIHIPGPSGLTTPTVNIVNYNGQRWNVTLAAFETYNSGHTADYAVTVIEDGSSGVYVGTFPSTITLGTYDILLYSPDANGVLGTQTLTWLGSGGIPPDPLADGLTFGEIKEQVLYNLGRGLTETNILAQIVRWGKLAMKDIINWRGAWFLDAQATVNIVAGQQTYNLPTDYKGNMKMFIQNTNRFDDVFGPIDILEAMRRFAPDSNGEPTNWSHYGDRQFKVYPNVPDKSYQMILNYERYIADLLADSDINFVTALYPSLLVAKMTSYGFKYLQEFDEAREWNSDADKVLMDLHANYVARTMGRDFSLTPRADVWGHADQSRGTAAYIIIK